MESQFSICFMRLNQLKIQHVANFMYFEIFLFHIYLKKISSHIFLTTNYVGDLICYGEEI